MKDSVGLYISSLLKQVDNHRIRLLGALAMLVDDGIISSGRAAELAGMSVSEYREWLVRYMRDGCDED